MKTTPTTQQRYIFNRVLGGAAEIFRVHTSTITGRSHTQVAAQPRNFTCYVLSQMGMSYAVIGGLLDRDHTTTLAAANRFSDALCEGKSWASHAIGLWLGETRPPTDGEAQAIGASDARSAITKDEEIRFLRMRVAELEDVCQRAAGAVR